MKTLIYNVTLIDSEIEKKNSAVLLNGKKIEGIPTKDALKKMLADESIKKIDGNNKILMPSFVDTHAHFRDPGLTYKEDIESGCNAAVAGGYTTLVLMPNTKPVVSSIEMAQENNLKAKKIGLCNIIQAVSITKDFDGITTSHLENLNSKITPVITEDGKEVCSSAVMLEAMKIASKKNIIVSCHCEDPFLADAARPLRKRALENLSCGKKDEAKNLLKQSDLILELAENCATLRNIRLAKEAGCHIHLCHVSTKVCVEAAKNALKENQNITFEITPHHIYFSTDKKDNILNIVNPPLRSEKNRLALIDSILNGACYCIGTDHAPHSAEDKKNGAPGFSGIETAFAVCNTVLVKENNLSLKKLSRLMSYNPCKLLGLKNKGLIKEGFDADLVLLDVEKLWTVDSAKFKSKGKFTPLQGKKLYGKILKTIYQGNVVFEE